MQFLWADLDIKIYIFGYYVQLRRKFKEKIVKFFLLLLNFLLN